MGATAVLIGRPVLWALAVGGEQGVAAVLQELTEEFTRAMMLCGAKTLGDIERSLIA
jgi:4-hydroxymandelate oxidase